MHLPWVAQWTWPYWEGQKWSNPRTWAWETSPTSHMPYGSMGGGKMPPPMPQAGGRTEVIRVGELLLPQLKRSEQALHLLTCVVQESQPCWQRCGWASPEGVNMGELSHYSSVMWWCRWERNTLTISHPSLPVTDKGTSPPPPLPLRKAGPFPCLRSTTEMILLTEAGTGETTLSVWE